MKGYAMHEETVNTEPYVETLEYSDQVGDLMTALANAQKEMENPESDSDNEFFHSRYPSMAAVRNATVPILAKHGIATTQHKTRFVAGRAGCITVLWYGGQFLKSIMECPIVKTRTEWRSEGGRNVKSSQVIPITELNHQDYVGVFNYLRRISLLAICNLSGELEDDGERAAGRGNAEDDGEYAAGRGKPSPARVPPGDMQRPRPETTQAYSPAQTPAARRVALVRTVNDGLERIVKPFDTPENGLQRAVVFGAFGVGESAAIRNLSVDTLEKGMPTFQDLCLRLAEDGIPEGDAGAWVKHRTEAFMEELRTMPPGSLTRDEEALVAAHDTETGVHRGL